jgi:uncharacterized protein (UPF0332 family)
LKVQTDTYLVKANECLDAAKQILVIGLPHVAAKEGYLAAYHAAQAFIFERTGDVVKTHRGIRSRFAEVTRDNPHIDRAFTTLLARAYKYKEIADYAVGSQDRVTMTEARELTDDAERFIDKIATLLSQDSIEPK